MGRPRQSQLLPLYRSEAQARVLAAIFLADEERPPHIRRIAQECALPYSTVQREVDRLERAHLVRSSTFANARVLRPDRGSPYFDDVYNLVLKSHGPVAVLRERIAKNRGIAAAYVYGSWAARYNGETGADPGDIDVLVVVDEGHPELGKLEDDLVTAGEILGREVSVVFTDTTSWSKADSPFLETLKKRPLVPVLERTRGN